MDLSAVNLLLIGSGLFLKAMGKGGFPAGTVALPLLILIWPAQSQAARQAVGFMLPMLCVMDAVAMLFYWRYVQWRRVVYLIPAMLVGVVLAGFLFVSDAALVAVSDRMLKALIGGLGIVFVIYFAAKKWILQHLHTAKPTWVNGSIYGFGAGVTSTLAHAAGPVMQMYLLPQSMEKRAFAATNCAFFWIMNLIKLIPFGVTGRLSVDNLTLGLWMLPVLPAGVAFGWWVTRRTQQKHYMGLIYVVLLITSFTLIIKAFS